MPSPVRRGAARSIAIYAATIGLVSGANFVTTPLLIALLPRPEFATWALIEPVILMSIPLAGFGLHIGIIRKVTGEQFADRRLVAGVLPYYLSSAAAVGCIAGLIAYEISGNFWCGTLAGLLVIGEGTAAFWVSLWRSQNFAFKYMVLEGGRAIGTLSVLVLALFALPLIVSSTADYLLIRVIAVACGASLAFLLVRPPWKPNGLDSREALTFGAPIVLASMCAALLTSVDRYALARIGTEGLLVTYVAHVKLAQVPGTVFAPFYSWFYPVVIRSLGAGSRDERFYINTTSIFVVLIAGACANTWVITPAIWPVLFPGVVLDKSLLAILLGGTAIYSVANQLCVGVLQQGKTHQALIITGAATVAGGAFSFALAPWFGAAGAAVGRGLGLLAYTLLFGAATVHALSFRYPWRMYLGIVVLVIAACFLPDTLSVLRGGSGILIRLVILNTVIAGALFATLRQVFPSRLLRQRGIKRA